MDAREDRQSGVDAATQPERASNRSPASPSAPDPSSNELAPGAALSDSGSDIAAAEGASASSVPVRRWGAFAFGLVTRRRLWLALPFLLGPLAARACLAPVGDAMAAAVSEVAPRTPAPEARGGAGEDDDGSPVERHGGRSARHGARDGNGGARRGDGATGAVGMRGTSEALGAGGAGAASDGGASSRSPGDAGVRGDGGVRNGGTIVVPASVVAAAIADKKAAARDAVDEDGKPIGARIVGVGKYKSGLQNGDIIVSVGGTPTPTTAALVEVGLKLLSSGATKLTGKIKRGDVLHDVVLELPARDR